MKRIKERLTDPDDQYVSVCQKCHNDNIEMVIDDVVCTDCGHVHVVIEQDF